MKKIIGIFLMLFVCLSSYATDFTGVKIYINPGHGGYNGANDRNIATINFALGDTLGFWESWSNLQKGLALRDMLQVANATVYMSRTQNRDEDDRLLSEIAEEANANGNQAGADDPGGRHADHSPRGFRVRGPGACAQRTARPGRDCPHPLRGNGGVPGQTGATGDRAQGVEPARQSTGPAAGQT